MVTVSMETTPKVFKTIETAVEPEWELAAMKAKIPEEPKPLKSAEKPPIGPVIFFMMENYIFFIFE